MIIISTCFYIKMDNHTSIFTLKADCPGMFLLDDPLPHPPRLLHLQDEDVAADADLDTGISIKLAGTLLLTSPGSRQSHLCTTSLFPSSNAFFRINSITCRGQILSKCRYVRKVSHLYVSICVVFNLSSSLPRGMSQNTFSVKN